MPPMTKLLTALATAGAIAASASPSLAANRTVKVDDDFFAKKSVTINKGNRVTWRWVGSSAHNVVGKGFNSGVRGKGFVFKKKFRKKGTFKYVCTIHPGMNGKVVVR